MTLSSKRVQTLLFCLLLIGKLNTVFAQAIEMKWGQEEKYSAKTLGRVLGEDENYYYIEKKKFSHDFGVDDYLIETYSMDHILQRVTTLDLKTPDGEDGVYERMYMLGDRFVCFFSRYDSKADMNILYFTGIDKAGKQDKPVIIDQEPAEKKKKKGSYTFVVSSDTTRLLIVGHPSFDKKADESFKFIMLAADLKIQWEKVMILPYNSREFGVAEYEVDEAGNVIMLCQNIPDRDLDLVQYKILVYDYKKNDTREAMVDVGKPFNARRIHFFYHKSGLHLIGFYTTEKSMKKGPAGIYYTRMNSQTLKVEVNTLASFDEKLISKFADEKDIKKYDGINPHYSVKDIVFHDNGKIYFVAENDEEVDRNKKTAEGNTLTTSYYYYKDMMVLQVNSDGVIEWATRIPKNQYCVDNRMYLSYLFTYNQNSLYFLYYDTPQNMIPSKSKDENKYVPAQKIDLANMKKPELVLATINSKGELEREVLKKPADTGKTYFVPHNNVRMAKNRVWIVQDNDARYRYGFLTIKGNN